MSTVEKFGQMFLAVAIFAAIFGLVLFVVDRVKGRQADRVAAVAFIAPAILLLAWGLLRPAVLTVFRSFKDATGDKWVGFENYQTMFTSSDQLEVLRNTFVWVLIVPFVASAIGLLYAIMVDGTRTENLAKALVFLPMAISMVGASVIWKFVYDYRPSAGSQIGLGNQILVWMGLDSYQFLLNEPWNNLFLIVVMIWIQAGFAMTILSAAIKAIPDDIVEAARLDGHVTEAGSRSTSGIGARSSNTIRGRTPVSRASSASVVAGSSGSTITGRSRTHARDIGWSLTSSDCRARRRSSAQRATGPPPAGVPWSWRSPAPRRAGRPPRASSARAARQAPR